LRNLTEREVGADLSDRWTVRYPNQWTALDVDHRTLIDETTIDPKLLDSAFRHRLLRQAD
jgi:hypothetical protein